jgi:Mlc titration factor MtfA (ptsG expression regulator)
MPADWRDVVHRRVALWRQLDDAERASAEAVVTWLVATRHWEAARGFTLEEHMTVTIAANAAVLAVGLGTGAYRDVSAVIVHPSTVTLDGQRSRAAPTPKRG